MAKNKRILVRFLFCMVLALFCGYKGYAQKDTIIVKQGDRLVGDIASVEKDVLLMNTAYSSDALPIKWNNILKLSSKKTFKVFDNINQVYIGKLKLDTADKKNLQIIADTGTILIDRNHIDNIAVYTGQRFKDRIKLGVDVGYITTRSRNAVQASIGLKLGYQGKRWDLTLDYLSYASKTDSITNSRGNITIDVKYLLPQNWFAAGEANFYESTEQNLDLRKTYLLGVGRFMIRRSGEILYIQAGFNYNDEAYIVPASSFKSGEIYGNVHYEYNVTKGININGDVIAYPSATEKGRFRSFSKAEVGYKFSSHFKTSVSCIINTDSRPPVTSNKTDYILNLKFGWTL